MIGYSQNIVKANAKANQKMLGVRLGKHCIRQGITVIEISNHFKVSRTAVYNWFSGVNDVSPKYVAEATAIIKWMKMA
jgi:transposase